MANKKSRIDIKYHCMGASKQVTGSCHLLKINVDNKPYNLVIDCGMVQNGLKSANELYKINKTRDINWEEVSGMVISHSHT